MGSRMRFLNSRDKRKIQEMAEEQWGSSFPELVFLENERSKIFGVTPEIAHIDDPKLRIQSFGVYFAEHKNDELRLTIEGAQLIGPKATRNIIELNDEEARDWMAGKDIIKEIENRGFVIIKNRDDFLGSGKFSATKGMILNYVPKTRRVNVID